MLPGHDDELLHSFVHLCLSFITRMGCRSLISIGLSWSIKTFAKSPRQCDRSSAIFGLLLMNGIWMGYLLLAVRFIRAILVAVSKRENVNEPMLGLFWAEVRMSGISLILACGLCCCYS